PDLLQKEFAMLSIALFATQALTEALDALPDDVPQLTALILIRIVVLERRAQDRAIDSRGAGVIVLRREPVANLFDRQQPLHDIVQSRPLVVFVASKERGGLAAVDRCIDRPLPLPGGGQRR